MKKIFLPLVLTAACLVSGPTLAFPNDKLPEVTKVMSQQINLNTATEKELATLPGIGKSKAKAIIEYRNEHGKITSLKELVQIKGVGKKVVSKLDGKVTL
ncbi:ComEA family DNA-binding protein [Neptunicella marina]|uniref:Helix-hairpin-helix domain-containing protein n=1 Tax=Neptunicella marina TaxID=2125989 RepID=A0A8J6IR41_9ALTE|nr:helix-hairpin-helix domain-containing protein [Neptunicella marina]MBC3764914.1 helix-hairpin-helix domain-containing protein [Neptunicella marina]